MASSDIKIMENQSNSIQKKAWFRPFGAGFYPINWQGWLTLLLSLIVVIGGTFVMQDFMLTTTGLIVSLIIYAIIFFIIFWIIGIHTNRK